MKLTVFAAVFGALSLTGYFYFSPHYEFVLRGGLQILRCDTRTGIVYRNSTTDGWVPLYAEPR